MTSKRLGAKLNLSARVVSFWTSRRQQVASVFSQSTAGVGMYVYVFKGADRIMGFTADVDGNNLPSAQGPWELTNRLNMSKSDDPRPLVDTQACVEDIELHGFHITNAHRRITDTLEP